MDINNIDSLLEAAQKHGEQDEPREEVKDLQCLCRLLWDHLSQPAREQAYAIALQFLFDPPKVPVICPHGRDVINSFCIDCINEQNNSQAKVTPTWSEGRVAP